MKFIIVKDMDREDHLVPLRRIIMVGPNDGPCLKAKSILFLAGGKALASCETVTDIAQKIEIEND